MKTFSFILLFFCSLGFTNLNGQEIISTSGDYFKTASGSMSSTIGEPIGETFMVTNYVLTQGFQQSRLPGMSVSEISGSNLKITVFPNPAKEFVNLKIEDKNNSHFSYKLIDNTGKLIMQKDVKTPETEISFTGLSPAIYFLKVLVNQKEEKNFKIVKQ